MTHTTQQARLFQIATLSMFGALTLLAGCGSKGASSSDGAALAGEAVATAATSNPSSPTSSPVPSPTPVPEVMFADTFSAGAFDNAWQNWSWGSTVTRDTTIRQSGTASLIVTIGPAAYGGLKPYKATSYSISDRTQISFDVYANDATTATRVKTHLAVFLEGPSITGKLYLLGAPEVTVTPSGAISAATWYHVVAPISALRVNNSAGQPDLTVINSVAIFDATGGANLAFRIDNLTLE